jgi:hypothetical protein
METVGCKYCGCQEFIEESDTRLRHLSSKGRDDLLIADYVGLRITWGESGGDPALGNTDGDWIIEFPDFLDHDEQLMYLYGEEQPYDKLKFDSDWNWLMPIVKIIEGGLSTASSASPYWAELNKEWASINRIYNEGKAFHNNNIGMVYRGVARYVKEYYKLTKNSPNDEDKSDI